jgi:hypothetical protein
MNGNPEFQKQLIDSLPKQAMWRFRETWVSFDFSRLQKRLLPVTAECIVGGPLPVDWLRYRVFGDERFDNVGAFVCIDVVDGSVVRIDVELEKPVSLLNTNVERFATSFGLLNDYFGSAVKDLEDLTTRLQLADSAAFDAGSHWWALTDYLK